jgi:tetratricopeptide (TPR) repeat protein
MLGLLAVDRRHFEASREPLQRALQLDPANVQALINLGIAEHGLGLDDQALAHFGPRARARPANLVRALQQRRAAP